MYCVLAVQYCLSLALSWHEPLCVYFHVHSQKITGPRTVISHLLGVICLAFCYRCCCQFVACKSLSLCVCVWIQMILIWESSSKQTREHTTADGSDGRSAQIKMRCLEMCGARWLPADDCSRFRLFSEWAQKAAFPALPHNCDYHCSSFVPGHYL